MFGAIRRNWHKAQALSVLQTAYEMPLKEPLDGLTSTELKLATKLIMQAGGTPFDTALTFMIVRADSSMRLGCIAEDDTHFVKLSAAGWATRDKMKLFDQHMIGIKRLGELYKAAKADGFLPASDIYS